MADIRRKRVERFDVVGQQYHATDVRHVTSIGNIEMTRKQSLGNLKEVLIKRRRALRQALAGDLSLLQELRQETSGDVVDFALDSAYDEMNTQLAEVESRELANIERALEKFEDSSYGKCEGCSCNIPLARLQALPYATLCIECKRLSEKPGFEANHPDWSKIIDSGSGDDVRLTDLDSNLS